MAWNGNNHFLSLDDSANGQFNKVETNSLSVYDLQPDKYVGTNSAKQLISRDVPGAYSLQETYDVSIPPEMNMSTTLRLYNPTAVDSRVLEIMASDNLSVGISFQGNGIIGCNTITSIFSSALQSTITQLDAGTLGADGILMTGGTSNTLSLGGLSTPDVENLRGNLDDNKKGYVTFNQDSKQLDLISLGIRYPGAKNIPACKAHEMRTTLPLLGGSTYFFRLYPDKTARINQIRIFFGANGSGSLRFAVYDDTGNDRIGQTAVISSFMESEEFTEVNFNSSFTVFSERKYWVGVTSTSSISNEWYLGYTHQNTTAVVPYNDVAYGSSVEYITTEFPASDPPPPDFTITGRLWYQLVGNYSA